MPTKGLPIPQPLREEYAEWGWHSVSRWPGAFDTYRLDAPSGRVRFVKLAAPTAYPTLPAEVERTRWAIDHLPVPGVVASGAGPDVDWMVTEGLAGRDAIHDCWSADHTRLVRALARGLRTFHSVAVDACPFDFTLDAALEHVRGRVDAGVVASEDDFHAEHRHLTPRSALDRLLAERPADEDLVVCHGDYCAPNILLHRWEPVGFVDLGEVGVADRWWDLAVATWSVGWNFGDGLESVFLEEYGVAMDVERCSYYRLLYDLVS